MHAHKIVCLAYAGGQTGPSGVVGPGDAHVSLDADAGWQSSSGSTAGQMYP